MASISSAWDLQASSAPRSICIFSAPSIPQPSSSRHLNQGFGGASSNNPFDNKRTYNNTSTNPFDSAARALSPSSNSSNPNANAALGDNSNSNTSKHSPDAAQYAIVFGTERGALHYRTYSHASLGIPGSSVNPIGEPPKIPPLGSMSGSSSIPSGRGSSQSRVVHAIHQPMDLPNVVSGAIVGVVQATYHRNQSYRYNPYGSLNNANPQNAANSQAPFQTFLLLVDDNRGSAPSSSSSPGTYAAQLVSLQYQYSPSASSSSSTTTTASFSNVNATSSRSSNNGFHKVNVSLPRMSAAAFHPSCGFVYAAGTNILSVGAATMKDIFTAASSTSHSLTSKNANISSTSPSEHHSHSHQHSSSLFMNNFYHVPEIIYKCTNVLPSNTKSGGQDALALVCQGHVAIVSVQNSFYAIAASTSTSSSTYSSRPFSSSAGTPPSTPKASTKSSLMGLSGKKTAFKEKESSTNQTDTNTAVKLLTLNQSSIHPVIILEISSPSTAHKQTASKQTHSSLLFLASGRECATVEIIYSPIPASVSTNSSASNTPASTGSRTAYVKQQHPHITTFPPRCGITSFPSPILAATSTMLPSSRLRKRKQASFKMGINNSNINNTAENAATNSCIPLLAILTSDGTLHIRSPSCIGVPLSVMNIGGGNARPNNFFALKEFPRELMQQHVMHIGLRGGKFNKTPILAVGYSGDAKVISCREDSSQEQADRIMRLCIDAFGMDNFPRSDLADAIKASFSATSHVGPEPTSHSRSILRQYLEVALGLTEDSYGELAFLPRSDLGEYEDAEDEPTIIPRGAFDGLSLNESSDGTASSKTSSSLTKAQASHFYVSASALLCLVCTHIPNGPLANRAAKSCASRIKITSHPNYPPSTVRVCEAIVDRLLNFAAKSASYLQQTAQKSESSYARNQEDFSMEFVEAALWLLRSCGKHDRALSVLQERMSIAQRESNPSSFSNSSSTWNSIKYESYAAGHLGELFTSEDENCTKLVLRSSATRKLLEQNPVLGLSVFMSNHPRNHREWKEFSSHKDPLGTKDACVLVSMVVELLKGMESRVSKGALPTKAEQKENFTGDNNGGGEVTLPLESGRALAVTYLESAIGISSGKPMKGMGEKGGIDALESLPTADGVEEQVEGLHDELVYLLLEGVIGEMGGDEDEMKGIGIDVSASDTELGKLYRDKLRRILSWPMAKYRADRVLTSLPSSFLREHALLLGRLGKHEDALKILYCDLKNLDLALEYCDARYERQMQQEQLRHKRELREGFGPNNSYSANGAGCSYLPLVKVALESSSSSHRGTAAAIQVLSLRRHAIDRGAALRLLPDTLPMSAVARPFLIPALVDSESEVRRLTVTASLLRAKYISLKHALTEAQITSQANLASVPALQSLNLGGTRPLRSSKSFKARSSSASSSTFPDVTITKHFFPRHVIIQVQVTNSAPVLQGRTLGDVAFFVAESSDEAISPSANVSIQTLPFNATGCAWCALVASPARLDGIAILTCELRYTVLSVDAATGAPLHFSGSGVGSKGRTYVEELQDVEVRSRDFDPNW